MSAAIAFVWFAAGLMTGAVVTAMYYRGRIQRVTETLRGSNQSLEDAVNNQPKEKDHGPTRRPRS